MLGGARPVMTAPPTGTIEGVAKDAQGLPLPGVQLTLRAATGRIAERATSGPDGRYSFADVAAGEYSISGAEGGFAMARAAVAIRAGEHASANLTLAAAAPGPAAAAPPRAAETAPPTSGPAPAPEPVAIEEVNVVAKRLEAVRTAIEPQIGASTYTVTRQAIEAQPGGANNTLNRVLLQTPGVSQDAESAGGIHVRNEMQPAEFRINGIPLPTGLSYFGQGLSPRFANSFNLITGALPAQYGLSTSGIIDIQTKNGLLAPGGFVSMYGGGYQTLQPSAEYGGSIGGYNYYVSGDFLGTNHGIDGVTPALTQIHDQSEQLHAFAYLDKIIDGENRVTAIAGLFNGRFEIPDNPATPDFLGITFLNGIPISAFNPAQLDERQNETSQFDVLSYLHSGAAVDFRISALTKYSTLHFRRDPSLSDIAFNGISQNALLKSFANGIQIDASGKIGADHTLRGGLLVTGERFTSQTVSSVLLQDGTDEFGNPTFGSTPATSFPSEIFASIGKTGWAGSAWLQDEWRVTSDLTVNYGARFDGVSQFVVGSQISPRLSSVWQATPTTVLHAGYARLFTPPPFQTGPAENLVQLNDFNSTGLTTSGATPSTLNDPLKIERANLFDVGATQNLFDGLKVGVDLYYKFARNGIDFGQFGAPIITIPFNYRIVANRGIELTTTYQNGPFFYYGNLAIAQQQAKGIVSAQFNFSPDDLAYIDTHSIQTDHSQLMTASSGLSYVWEGTRFSVDLLAGTGTRTTRPSGPPNGGSLPSYSQTNLGISHIFELPRVGAIKVRFDVINLFDESYLLRSSTSLGAFAPAFGPRRTFYAGVTKEF
jgi:outer membrane receptor protein involved in Fe transport